MNISSGLASQIAGKTGGRNNLPGLVHAGNPFISRRPRDSRWPTTNALPELTGKPTQTTRVQTMHRPPNARRRLRTGPEAVFNPIRLTTVPDCAYAGLPGRGAVDSAIIRPI